MSLWFYGSFDTDSQYANIINKKEEKEFIVDSFQYSNSVWEHTS